MFAKKKNNQSINNRNKGLSCQAFTTQQSTQVYSVAELPIIYILKCSRSFVAYADNILRFSFIVHALLNFGPRIDYSYFNKNWNGRDAPFKSDLGKCCGPHPSCCFQTSWAILKKTTLVQPMNPIINRCNFDVIPWNSNILFQASMEEICAHASN